jgi:membrane protease YdiL (CAAX protease family)
MKKAVLFLVLTFLLSWPVAFGGCSALQPYTAAWLVMAVWVMFTPLISTIIVQKLVYRQPLMKPLHISFRPNRWFLVAVLFPAFLAVAATAVSLLFPGVSFSADLTEANYFLFFGKNFSRDQVAALARSAADMPLHPMVLLLIGGTIAGITVNGVAGFGEELGWRGLLLRETARLGFWRASFVTGVIWGLWHLPFLIHGHNYPGHPFTGVLMLALWTVSFTPLIAYVCIRSNSVIAAAIMHGAINGTAIAPLLVLKGGNDLQIGVMGLAGILVLFCCNVLLLAFGAPGKWLSKWETGSPCCVADGETP